ncbi:hypothetical protein T02_2786 [Trichinella nativa]|uniref:Uncharacterized protein n=1 Tax=Trichinella nativa TaxID=6335 RepID=A0A0V1KJ32_9BILA|nr:hypothetical protein T02_2786 [Trichinella nativa]
MIINILTRISKSSQDSPIWRYIAYLSIASVK